MSKPPMFNKFKQPKYYIPIISLLVLLLSFVGFKVYQYGAFKRAYETGITYEQLDTLMNTTRYADEVREAGYEIDNLDLVMSERIVSLFTKGNPSVEVVVPSQSSKDFEVVFFIEDQSLNIYLTFNSDMTLASSDYVNTKDRSQVIIPTSEEEAEYVAYAKSQIEEMLTDVYDSMYG